MLAILFALKSSDNSNRDFQCTALGNTNSPSINSSIEFRIIYSAKYQLCKVAYKRNNLHINSNNCPSLLYAQGMSTKRFIIKKALFGNRTKYNAT